MEYMGPNDRRRFLNRAFEVHRRTGGPVPLAEIRADTGWVEEYTAAFAEKLRADDYIELSRLGDGSLGVIPKRAAD